MRRRSLLLLPLLALLAGCGGVGASGDRFVDAPSGEVASFATSPDGRLRVPLRRGLTWAKEPSVDGSLLRVRADEGPTYVVAAVVEASGQTSLRACAELHRARMLAAASAKGIDMTPPRLVEEAHRGVTVPRVSYAVALEAAAGVRPASLMSSWTYLLDAPRCLAIGVSTVVRAKADDPAAPDPDDLSRLEAVYEVLADGVSIASP